MYDSILKSETDAHGVATLTINRPAVHNAFNEELISSLRQEFDRIALDQTVRVVVLAAAGKSFSSGADINWMKELAGYDHKENLAGAFSLAEMLKTLDCLPQPTIARVQGIAFAGGLGLIGACDIAIAAETAVFAVTEVRIGLVPAVISPYAIRALGKRAARRYFLTGERFNVAEAHRLGLIHGFVSEDVLDEFVSEIITSLLLGGPKAIAESKRLISELVDDVGEARMKITAERIADVRSSMEANEGMQSFLEKREPRWNLK